jgi:hypothetical protein
MPKLPNLHLHRVFVDNEPLPLVINARSQAAVRDHIMDRHIRIERLTPGEAFQAGVGGAVFETAGEAAAAEQSVPPQTAEEPGLFDQATNAPDAEPDAETDVTSRPTDGRSPGYVAALSEAATL